MKKPLIVLLILLAGSLLVNTYFFSQKKSNNGVGAKDLATKYPLLSHRILNDFDRDLLINFVDLRKELRAKAGGYGSDFTVYFEYLPTGTSIGVNEKTEFFAASLLKVPTVMAYYHRREKENIKDDPVLKITQSDIDEHFGTLYQRGIGGEVKMSEAIKLALTESDNTAINLITDQVRPEDYEFIFSGLDIEEKVEKDNKQFIITTKSYSSILKALYFAALLTKEDSNLILQQLSETKYNDKLPAGVPTDVTIAHKIAVYENVQVPIYSDCGIVYLPRRQYILCMASRGDEATAKDRMKTISKMVYDFVSTAKSPQSSE